MPNKPKTTTVGSKARPRKRVNSKPVKIKKSSSRIKRRLDLIANSFFSMFSGIKRSKN